MKLQGIGVAENGFILHDSVGKTYIAKTLTEAAMIAGESTVQPTAYTNYNPGFSHADLRDVKILYKQGDRIAAIKLLRNCFSPKLCLREAKELVEQLCG